MFTLYTHSHSDTSNRVPDHSMLNVPVSSQGLWLSNIYERIWVKLCLCWLPIILTKVMIFFTRSECNQAHGSHGNISGKCSLRQKAFLLSWGHLLIADSRKGRDMSYHQRAKNFAVNKQNKNTIYSFNVLSWIYSQINCCSWWNIKWIFIYFFPWGTLICVASFLFSLGTEV